MRLYKVYYRIIGAIIAILGLLLTPSVLSLINGILPVVNNYVLYLMNLSAPVCSY